MAFARLVCRSDAPWQRISRIGWCHERVPSGRIWRSPAVRGTEVNVCLGLFAVISGLDANVGLGSTIEFREEELLLLRSGYV